MKRVFGLSVGLVAALALSACNTPQQTNAAVGGVMGGATGAAIGSIASGGQPGATIVGGLVGAAAGAMVGSAVTPAGAAYAPPPPPRACAVWGYDYYGNHICRSYY